MHLCTKLRMQPHDSTLQHKSPAFNVWNLLSKLLRSKRAAAEESTKSAKALDLALSLVPANLYLTKSDAPSSQFRRPWLQKTLHLPKSRQIFQLPLQCPPCSPELSSFTQPYILLWSLLGLDAFAKS